MHARQMARVKLPSVKLTYYYELFRPRAETNYDADLQPMVICRVILEEVTKVFHVVRHIDQMHAFHVFHITAFKTDLFLARRH